MSSPWNRRLMRELDRQDAEQRDTARQRLVDRLTDAGMNPDRAETYAGTMAGTLGAARKVRDN